MSAFRFKKHAGRDALASCPALYYWGLLLANHLYCLGCYSQQIDVRVDDVINRELQWYYLAEVVPNFRGFVDDEAGGRDVKGDVLGIYKRERTAINSWWHWI